MMPHFIERILNGTTRWLIFLNEPPPEKILRRSDRDPRRAESFCKWHARASLIRSIDRDLGVSIERHHP